MMYYAIIIKHTGTFIRVARVSWIYMDLCVGSIAPRSIAIIPFPVIYTRVHWHLQLSHYGNRCERGEEKGGG